MSEGFPWEDPLKELPHEQRAMHKNTIVPICSNHSDSEFIKNQIKLNAELHRECQEEYKQLQKDVDRIREESLVSNQNVLFMGRLVFSAAIKPVI